MTTFKELKAERNKLPHRLTLTTFKGKQVQVPTSTDAVTGVKVYGNAVFGLTLKGREEVKVYGDDLYRHGWGQLYVAIHNSDLNDDDKQAALTAADALEDDDYFQAALGLVKFVRGLDPHLSRLKVVDAAMDYVAEQHDFPMGFSTARQLVFSVL